MVLPTPGTSSISRCPPASRQDAQSRSWRSLPRITVCSSRKEALIPAKSSLSEGSGTAGDSGEGTDALQLLFEIGDALEEFRRSPTFLVHHRRGRVVHEGGLVQLGLRLGE